MPPEVAVSTTLSVDGEASTALVMQTQPRLGTIWESFWPAGNANAQNSAGVASLDFWAYPKFVDGASGWEGAAGRRPRTYTAT